MNEDFILSSMAIALSGLLGAFYGVWHTQQYPKTFQSVRVKLLIALAGLFTVAFVVGGLCVLSCHMADTMGSIMIVLLVSDVVPVFKKVWKHVPEDVNKSGN